MTISHNDNLDCPSARDLRAFVEGGLDARAAVDIHTHVATCQVCTEAVDALRSTDSPTIPTERLRHWRELGRRPAATFGRLWATSQPEEPESGQLWTTLAPARDEGGRIVVVLDTNVLLTAAPICLELGLLGDRDVSVLPDESPLGYPFMVETWNLVHTDRSMLKRYLGRLDRAPMQTIQVLLRGGSAGPSDRVGPPLWGRHDPRTVFQENERTTCSFLQREPSPSLPTVSPQPSETVTIDGAALRARRRSLGLSFETLAEALLKRGFGDEVIGPIAEAERHGEAPVPAALADAINVILRTDTRTSVVKAASVPKSVGGRRAFAQSDPFRRRVFEMAARSGADANACLKLVEAEWLGAAARESNSGFDEGDESAWVALLDRLIVRAIERIK